MKRYTLDLASYKVGKADLNVKDELYSLLRLPGIYANGIEMCDGIILAKSINGQESDELEINEAELNLLKRVLNILIGRPNNPPMSHSLGGIRYEELILRVFMLDRE